MSRHLSPGLPQTGEGSAGTCPPPRPPPPQTQGKISPKGGRENPGQSSLRLRHSRQHFWGGERKCCPLGFMTALLWDSLSCNGSTRNVGPPWSPTLPSTPPPSVGAGLAPPSKSGVPSLFPPFHHPVGLTSPPGVTTSTRVFISRGWATRSL